MISKPRSLIIIAAFLYDVLLCFNLHGQISLPGKPLNLYYPGSKPVPVYSIDIPESQRVLSNEQGGSEQLKIANTGIMIPVEYKPETDGVWDTVYQELKIWRIAFRAENAVKMNIYFESYLVNKGVRIFIYDSNQDNILGAFSDINNKASNTFVTSQIPGKMLIMEMQVPAYLENYGKLVISGIGCDLSNENGYKSVKDGWYGTSGNCNVDIGCFNVSPYNKLKNAVVRIIFNGGSRCTGTLVNNTLKNEHPYVLTAEHCISDEAAANTAVFYFGYESPYCDGPDGNTAMSVSGSTLIATGGTLDFTLLELQEQVPFEYQPYYAGWDYTGISPSTSFAIHHPQGDVKKISFQNEPLTTGSFLPDYLANTHWLVDEWELGTTENGSSGCPLFSANGYLVGTLTGGLASCSYLSGYDKFQMFGQSWNRFSLPGNQLKIWLDPINLNPGVLGGYDPYADFRATGDTLTNIMNSEMLKIENGSLTWGSYAGHNSDYLNAFAERFEVTHASKILGLLLNVNTNYVASASAYLNIKVWTGDGLPESEIYQKQVALADITGNELNFVKFDSAVNVNGEFFTGYELFYTLPQDTFSCNMAENRMISQVNTAYVYNGTNWFSLNNYTGNALYSSFDVRPVVYDSLMSAIPEHNSTDQIILFPNPAGEQYTIEFHETLTSGVRIMMYNMQGQMVKNKTYEPYRNQVTVPVADLINGLYIVNIITEKGTYYSAKVSLMRGDD